MKAERGRSRNIFKKRKSKRWERFNSYIYAAASTPRGAGNYKKDRRSMYYQEIATAQKTFITRIGESVPKRKTSQKKVNP